MTPKILVLCTGNSCRSQIAEAYLRYFSSDNAEIYSAGIEIHGVNPRAVAIMQEDGIDISRHTSNHLDEYSHIPFDIVITVCDNARESCPVFPSSAKKNFTTTFPIRLKQQVLKRQSCNSSGWCVAKSNNIADSL